MPKKGTGLLIMWAEIPAESEDELRRWYDEEHLAEVMAVPGVLNAARYEALRGGPRYLACYELDSHEAWYSDEWQKWLREPTEWSRRMSPSVIGTEYIRNLYQRVHPDELSEETASAGMSPLILVGRMSIPDHLEEAWNDAYNNERLPMALDIPGYIRARRFQAVMGEPKYATVHEMESLEVAQSEAWQNWSRIVTPVWTHEVRPHMVHGPGSPGVYQRIFPK